MSHTTSRPSTSSKPVRHGQLRKSNPAITVVKAVASALAVVLVSGLLVAGITLVQLGNNIKTVDLQGQSDGPPPALGDFEGGFNILLAGSDTRLGQGEKGPEGARNDVNILLHVSQDQTNAVAVSIPRDLVVPIPACPHEDDNGSYPAKSAQPINTALGSGGLPCVVLTVQELTGLKIPFAGAITFDGVTNVSTAVGGVPVCINGPFYDNHTKLRFPAAGTYTLEGHKALLFLRSRYGVGDGSDLGRISSQQVFLSSLVRTVKSNDTLTDFTKLFRIATVVSESTTLSSSLKNLNTMVSMAQVLKKIPLESITFVQYPGTTGVGGIYAGKVAPIENTARALFDKIKADEPFTVQAGKNSIGSVTDPNAPATAPTATGSSTSSAAPTSAPPADLLQGVIGQSAADYTCTKVNR